MKIAGTALIAVTVLLAAATVWQFTESWVNGAIVLSWTVLAGVAGGALLYAGSRQKAK